MSEIIQLITQGLSGSQALLDNLTANTVHVTVLDDRYDNDTSNAHSLSWDELAAELTTHVRSERKNNKAIVFGRFVDGPCTKLTTTGKCTEACPGKNHRIDANVIEMTALGLDFDNASEEQLIQCLATIGAKKLKHVWYTTFSSSTAQLKIRIVIALSLPVPGTDWERFWNAALDHLGVRDFVDRSCINPSRVFYRPCCPASATPSAEAIDGQPLDVDMVMALAAPALPVAARSSAGPKMYGTASPELLAHARERLREHGPAVPTTHKKGANNHTRTAWGILVQNLALTNAEARPLIEEFAATCEPPWDLDELYAGPARADQSWKDAYGGERDAWAVLQHLPTTGAPNRATKANAEEVSVQGYQLTDLGNAQCFVDEYQTDIRYVHAIKKWIIWNGKFWRPDDNDKIRELIKDNINRMIKAAVDLPEDALGMKKRDLNWALKSGSAKSVDAIEKLARTVDARIKISPDKLDLYPWDFNVANGTVDLRTGVLRPHAQADMITHYVAIKYDAGAVCPNFLKTIQQIFPAATLQDFFQRSVGLSLTGETFEKAMFLCIGDGDNGKSTLMTALKPIFGTYGTTSEMSTFVAQTSGFTRISNEVRALMGHRQVSAAELAKDKFLDEALVKQLTGGDDMKARGMYKEGDIFVAIVKIWLLSNYKPRVKGTDPAIWKRLMVIPFNVRFLDPPVGLVGSALQAWIASSPLAKNKQLPDLLKKEQEGIMAWAIRGAVEVYQNGLGSCVEVETARTSYRTEQDPIGPFLEDMCVIDVNAKCHIQDLIAKYKPWCYSNNCNAITEGEFKKRLDDLGYKKSQVCINTNTRSGYIGIRLKTLVELNS